MDYSLDKTDESTRDTRYGTSARTVMSPMQPIRVLYVEDNPIDRLFFRRLLTHDSEREFEVVATETGQDGLDLCCTFRPECILLDYHLPDMDGSEFLAKLSSDVNSKRSTAVLILTNEGNERMAAEAIEHGAHNFILKREVDGKGLKRAILAAMAKVGEYRREFEDKQRFKTYYANEVRERANLEHRLKATREQLEIARFIQRGLLPTTSPDLAGLEIAGICLPADETGGDFFDYIRFTDGTIGVLIGDVMEHGLGPALIAAEIRAYIRAFSLTELRFEQILSHVNELLWEDVQGSYFATLFAAKLWPGSRAVECASAGHIAHILRADGTLETICGKSLPLGVDGDLAIERCTQHAALRTGDLLVMLTDGIFEPHNDDGKPFGMQRALQTILEYRGEPCSEILKLLVDEVAAHSAGHQPHDDMTAVLIKATWKK